jgi:peptidoglycan/LPS O-acetylase OafA/YrhL
MIQARRLREWCLRHVARPRPAQAFVPQIDGLRCVAIVSVILYHVQGYVAAKAGVADPGWLFRVFAQGYFGVPLFFALSGYIIACQFLGPKPADLRRYFIRRLTRLEPPYLISMLLVFTVKLWALDLAFPALFPHLLASLVYLHNLVFASHSEVNGVAWSLEIEWQFYLLAPLAFAAVLRAPGRARHAGLWVFIILGGYAYAVGSGLGPRFALSLLHYFGFFAAGVWVALLDAEQVWARISTGYDLLGGAAAVAILAVLLRGEVALPALPALTALIVLCALRGPVLRRVLGWWPVHCVGAMCYTIYLYHFFVVSALGRLYVPVIGWSSSPGLSLVLFALFAVPLVVAICLLPYVLIERPFMVWRPGKNRLIDAFTTQPASTSPA